MYEFKLFILVYAVWWLGVFERVSHFLGNVTRLEYAILKRNFRHNMQNDNIPRRVTYLNRLR